ncbi:MAG TPA: response regulator [Mycobacteriales bacterium]|nr:response regulator [Mycobacteriales bacterium]
MTAADAAHDLANLLAIVIARAALIARQTSEASVRADAEAICVVAEQAASLARRALAPADEPMEDEEELGPVVFDRAEPAARTGVRVLVVDDDPTIRLVVARSLAFHGYEDVRTAADADEALAHLSEQPVDVVVTDVQMPGTRGDDLAAMVRDIHPSVRFVFHTGSGPVEVPPGAIHLLKPASSEELAQAVAEAMT